MEFAASHWKNKLARKRRERNTFNTLLISFLITPIYFKLDNY